MHIIPSHSIYQKLPFDLGIFPTYDYSYALGVQMFNTTQVYFFKLPKLKEINNIGMFKN